MSYLTYDENYNDAILRFFYIVPLTLASSILVYRTFWVRSFLNVYVFLILMGCSSVFYQLVFGPVSWFADASERDGLVRYSSMLGSLTVLGIAGGLALPAIFFSRISRTFKVLLVLFVCLGMLVTLQKAAVINIAVFLVLVCYELIRHKRFLLLFSFLALSTLILLSVIFFDLGYLSSTVRNVVRIGGSAEFSDVSLFQSVRDRIWVLPSALLDVHGVWGLLAGVGMVGGSGALGFPDYPMAHNVYFDYLFIGGVIYLGTFLFLFMYSWRKFHVLMNSGTHEDRLIYRAVFFIQLLVFINLPFASGMQYQPVTGGMMMCLIFLGALMPKHKQQVVYDD
jgi:hypothetical protein